MSTPLPSEEQRFLRWSGIVAVIAFLLFTIGIWNQPFVGFEINFVLFAKEMLRHGISFFPTIYGKPYPDYPVTSTLAIYFFAKIFGLFNKFIAVLPTVLASAGIVTLTFLLLVRSSLNWAIAAICFEWMTFTFLQESRTISLDQMVSLITLTSFYVAYRSEITPFKREYFWLISLFIAGFLVRGPIGIILPAAVIGSYFCITKNIRKALTWGLIALATVLIMWLVQLGLAWHQEGLGFVNEVIRLQVTDRMNFENPPHPFYFYFTSSFWQLAPTFPLFVLASIIFLFHRKSLTGSAGYVLMLGLISWVVVIMLGLSIPHAKHTHYLLPIIPPLCAVASYPFAVEALPRLKGFLKSFLSIYPFLILVVLLYGEKLAAHKGIDVSQQVSWAVLALILLQLVSAMSFLLRNLRLYQTGLICGSAALASWFSIILVVEPTLNKLHDTSMFVAQAEQIRNQRAAPLAFYKNSKWRMEKYMVNLDKDEIPYFPETEKDLMDLPKPIYILMEESTKDKLSEEVSASIQVLVSGKFDDKTNLSLVFWPARNNNGVSRAESH